MSERQSEFTNFKPICVAMGTWNVNGGKQFRSNLLGTTELADWLLDSPTLSSVAESPGECGYFGDKGQVPLTPGFAFPITIALQNLAFDILFRMFRKRHGLTSQNISGELTV